MLRVNKVADRLDQSPALGDCVTIISTGGRPGGGLAAGARALGVRLLMLPPGTRGMPHFHSGHEAALYIVSGEIEVWHGEGLVRRSTARPGDFLRIPPGVPHLSVNRGDVTAIAIAARDDRADDDDPVVVGLPRHLASLLSLPVAQE